jgi:hypothetical protein
VLLVAVVVLIGVVAANAFGAVEVVRVPETTRDSSPQIVVRASGVQIPGVSTPKATVNERAARVVPMEDGSYRVDTGRLPEGEHRITLRSGPFGRTRSWTVVVDRTPPSLAIARSVRTVTNDRSFTVEGTSEPGASVVVTAGGVRKEPTVDPAGTFGTDLDLRSGVTRVVVTSRDRAGNLRRLTRTVVLDQTAPRLRAVNAPRVVSSARAQLRVAARDEQSPAAGLQLDASFSGQPALVRRDRAGFTITPAKALLEGTHEWNVQATDEAGNVTRIEGETVVDSSEDLATVAGLRSGARGSDVTTLRRELAGTGIDVPRVGAIYDEHVVAAVREFQASNELAVDGVAGAATLAALTFRIEVDQSEHQLRLMRFGRSELTVAVAVGSKKYPTPNGEFRILDKQKDPTWNPPDSEWARGKKPIPPGPDNPLGTRWMGLGDALGIHGTNSPASLGFSVTHGCIRLSIPDVERLFELVPSGTKVVIRP